MRSKILGTIGVLWGGSVIASGLVRGAPDPSKSSYGAGQFAGFVFGSLLVGAGLYALFTKSPSQLSGLMRWLVKAQRTQRRFDELRDDRDDGRPNMAMHATPA